MQIKDITSYLESIAPVSLQESYDNAGLLTGLPDQQCTGIVCTLDATEEVVTEAKQRGCNLVIAHHPIIFSGLKKLNGNNYIEKTIIAAIKNDIAIYAIHTNLDNILQGVNQTIAEKIGLEQCQILLPKPQQLLKLYTFVPRENLESVRNALFAAGAGYIGKYSEASFGAGGTGTFKGMEGANPAIGEVGIRSSVDEIKLECLVPAHLKSQVTRALINSHPYEEVAYDWVQLQNDHSAVGSGLIGVLPEPLDEKGVLQMLCTAFDVPVIRHTPLLGKPIRRVAVCGGAGSFLIGKALQSGADLYITADIKYHEFFEANQRMVIADIGHWESEQYTIDWLMTQLQSKFLTFAVLKSGIHTNPVRYFIGT